MHTHTSALTYPSALLSTACMCMAASLCLCAQMFFTVLVVLMSWGLVAAVPHGAGPKPVFSPDVLVYTLAPDSDAEPRGKDGIHVEGRFVVYGGICEDISLCCCRCWCHGSSGVEVQLVSVTSGPPRPPPRQCQTPRWDRLSACQLQGQRRLIV